MKIIAETKIGSREKYYNYHNNGVAGIFINDRLYNEVRHLEK